MRIDVTNNSSTYIGLSLALMPSEIDALINRLTLLRSQPDQHFHLSSSGDKNEDYVDIEISVQPQEESPNAWQSGFAIDPSDFTDC